MYNKQVELKFVHLPLMDQLDVYLLFSSYVQLTLQQEYIHLPNPIKVKKNDRMNIKNKQYLTRRTPPPICRAGFGS